MKLKMFFSFWTVVVAAFISVSSAQAESAKNRVAILPTTDSSNYNLGDPLQKALGRLFKETGTYQPVISTKVLTGFTPIEVNRVLTSEDAASLSFALLEQQRISVFLFDKDHPSKFIASSKSLGEGASSEISSKIIEAKFREAFKETIQFQQTGKYQDLPKAKSEEPVFSRVEPSKKKEKGVRFYGGLGMLATGRTEYHINNTNGQTFPVLDYPNTKELQFNIGMTTMFGRLVGLDYGFQYGRLSNTGMKGWDSNFSFLLAPHFEFNFSKRLLFWVNAGVRLNRISIGSWYNDQTSGAIFPKAESKFAVGFTQGFGFQYQIGNNYFIDLSGTHQTAKINDHSATWVSLSPAATGEVQGAISYDTWVAFLSIGTYL